MSESNDRDFNRTVYARESNSTGWFVGIIVALALLAIGYLVFVAAETRDCLNGPADACSTTIEASE